MEPYVGPIIIIIIIVRDKNIQYFPKKKKKIKIMFIKVGEEMWVSFKVIGTKKDMGWVCGVYPQSFQSIRMWHPAQLFNWISPS